MVSIRRFYGDWPLLVRHPLPNVAVGGLAVAVAIISWAVVGEWADREIAVIAAGVVLAVSAAGALTDAWRWRVFVLAGVLAAVAVGRAGDAVDDLAPRELGPYSGWARIVDDPQPYGRTTRVTLQIEGERFEYWARSRAKRARVDGWRGGDRVLVEGEREALTDERQQRVASQHVVGEFTLGWVAERAAGGPLDRASNRVRSLLERGATALPGADGALFRGLVIGDDRDQPREMVDRFRASGLSHLTAVSGQNVAFVLAALGPLLRRLRPTLRWVATVGVIAWFVALTRFEPSIVRAGTMAAISATAFVLGRERAPARLLAIAVIALLLVDPLLVRSVGFWLSVGATAGVTTVGPWLAGRLRSLGVLATPLAISLGAQIGVAVPALVVFGRLPLVSIAANLLAVPVAGFVMLYGLPAGLLAGAVPPVAPIVMLPCRLGVRWVDLIARLGERIEPGGRATWVGWVILVGGVGVAVAAGAAKKGGRDERASADR